MSSHITNYTGYLTPVVFAPSAPAAVQYSYSSPIHCINYQTTPYEPQELHIETPQRHVPVMDTAQDTNESDVATTNHTMPDYGSNSNIYASTTCNTEPQSFVSGGTFSQDISYNNYPSLNGASHGGAPSTMHTQQPGAFPADGHTIPATSANIEHNKQSSRNPHYGEMITSINPRTGRKRSIWRCRGCGRVTQTKRDMKRHILILRHGGRRKHKCRSCKRSYTRKDSVQRHIRDTGCGEQKFMQQTAPIYLQRLPTNQPEPVVRNYP